MEWKKVNIIAVGDKDENAWYAHVFRAPDGTLIEETCSQAEYAALALKDCINPTKKGYTWSHSYADHRYDTPSGRLENMTYANESDGVFLARKDGEQKHVKMELNDAEELQKVNEAFTKIST